MFYMSSKALFNGGVIGAILGFAIGSYIPLQSSYSSTLAGRITGNTIAADPQFFLNISITLLAIVVLGFIGAMVAFLLEKTLQDFPSLRK